MIVAALSLSVLSLSSVLYTCMRMLDVNKSVLILSHNGHLRGFQAEHNTFNTRIGHMTTHTWLGSVLLDPPQMLSIVPHEQSGCAKTRQWCKLKRTIARKQGAVKGRGWHNVL